MRNWVGLFASSLLIFSVGCSFDGEAKNKPSSSPSVSLFSSASTTGGSLFSQDYCENGNLQQSAVGGGGRMPVLAVSPHDDQILVMATDMGTVFRSIDGGVSFIQIPSLELNRVQMFLDKENKIFSEPIAWNPGNPDLVFAGTKYALKKSTDKGQTWTEIVNVSGAPQWDQGPYLIKFSNIDPSYGVAAFHSVTHNGVTYDHTILYTYDSGDSWWPANGAPMNTDDSEDIIRGIVFDERMDEKTALFVATTRGVFYREKYNIPWTSINAGLPSDAYILNFDGVSAVATFRDIYLSTKKDSVNPSRIYRLKKDGQFSWTDKSSGLAVFGNDLQFRDIAVPEANPDYVYVTYEGGQSSGAPMPGSTYGDGGVFKSTNSGNLWDEVFFQHYTHQFFNTSDNWLARQNWPWAQAPDMIETSSLDPDLVFISASGIYKSANGGGFWDFVAGNGVNPDGSTDGGGVGILAVWDYIVDPVNTLYHYLASSDFALWQSEDGGSSWQKKASISNIYKVAFAEDSTVAGGRVYWAVGGQTHGIPRWPYLGNYQNGDPDWKGKILYSTDNFQTFSTITLTDPTMFGPVTDIYIKQTNSSSYQIWVSVLGKGIFRSFDKGNNWFAFEPSVASNVFNRNFIKVGQLPNGKMYGLTTARNSGANYDRGNLYFYEKLSQGAWSSEKKFSWPDGITYPTSVAFDSNGTKIYVSSWTTPQEKSNQSLHGGVWVGDANGDNWVKIYHVGTASVTVDPDDADRIFASVSDVQTEIHETSNENFGLFESYDGGANWSRNSKFVGRSPQKLSIQSGEAFLTTLGNGVFRCQ